jgi:hypothetical protein
MKKGDNETCCPEFDPKKWDKKKVTWKGKLFVKDKAFSFFHIPLNLTSTIKEIIKRLQLEKATDKETIILTDDHSAFSQNVYISARKPIKKAYDVKVTATFISKVFEGKKKIKKWEKEMTQFVESKGKKIKHFYFYHPYCPQCAKKYGTDYTVILAEI